MRVPILCALMLLCAGVLNAADFGKEVIGRLQVQVYFGCNGDPSVAGEGLATPSPAVIKQLQSLRGEGYQHYRIVGGDRQPVFRIYENWLTPLKPSEELLLSFEPRGNVQDGKLMLDLELWQSHKKIMKAGPTLSKDKPLFIIGPMWRGGRLVLEIQLVEIIQ